MSLGFSRQEHWSGYGRLIFQTNQNQIILECEYSLISTNIFCCQFAYVNIEEQKRRRNDHSKDIELVNGNTELEPSCITQDWVWLYIQTSKQQQPDNNGLNQRPVYFSLRSGGLLRTFWLLHYSRKPGSFLLQPVIHSTWLPPHGSRCLLEVQPSLQHPSQQEGKNRGDGRPTSS